MANIFFHLNCELFSGKKTDIFKIEKFRKFDEDLFCFEKIISSFEKASLTESEDKNMPLVVGRLLLKLSRS